MDESNPSTERAERMASWLEGLGLAEQLATAGLPTFTRDDDGVARWLDPRTGAALDADRLAELETQLRRDGDEAEHAVPVALVQLRHLARVRAALLDSPTHDYASLAAVRGASENATRFAVHKAAERSALLVISHQSSRSGTTSVLVPAFQLDAAGELRAELAAVLEPLLSVGTDPWKVWAWLTQPAALLGGAVPHEAARDPEELPIVRHAAVRLAERARANLAG
ncbi:hypothetical protein [Nocardioides sp. R-C-SC26]|uniref:hypothetical protein n=1 Tax=Nocardioides sp. R-C-SC26 TaxID=2870414 RepID=UPI001E2ECB95|nr:hypothetical protein [Nocardioides sp. R-C-SC26]